MISLSDVTNEVAINFIVTLKNSKAKNGKPFKAGALNSYLRNIKTAFNWAVKEQIIRKNPWKGISKLQDPSHKQFRYLKEDDITLIREYLTDKPSWQLDIFNLCLWTGARRGEAFNIDVQDLYVDDIKSEMVPFVRLTGKGDKTRNMPLCAEASELLDRRVSYLKNDNKQFEIIDKTSITKAFGRARIALGLDYFNAHSLRHSFATYCLKDDVPISTVKEFLGHIDIATTMIYAKTDDELKAMNIKKFKAR